jgi:hypothetical protein
MEGTWFSGVADELARCVTDAQASAEACEALLEAVRDAAREDAQRIARTLVPQAAIARVLIDLIDQPPQLVLAACKLCSDSARDAIRDLERSNGGLDVSRAVSALRASAESCDRLLEAVR